MQNFKAFMKENKEKAYALARKNGRYDTHGRYIISKDEDWAKEDIWEIEFEEGLETDESARGVACRVSV